MLHSFMPSLGVLQRRATPLVDEAADLPHAIILYCSLLARQEAHSRETSEMPLSGAFITKVAGCLPLPGTK